MKYCLVLLAACVGIYGFAQGFVRLDPQTSGIEFRNRIVETDMVNGLTYEYLYNGGGVSIADFNRDGREDLFFTGNQQQNRLYLNKGKMRFADATKKYFGPDQPEGFSTGSTIVDINDDGYPDIYVSRAGWYEEDKLRRNLLYVNQGGKRFVEMAAEYGIADSSCTTQAVFFDADLDGDQDLYLLNHIRWRKRAQKIRTDQPELQVMGQDAYYENRNGKFFPATKDAGLLEDPSFGLGVAVSDLNNDGYPDIYVSNDYHQPDRLYLNKGNGTFTEVIKLATNHIALYAMGVDIADINNDGLIDVFSVDMASEDHIRSKKNMAGMSSKTFWHYVNSGYHYQYMFNSLQLNMGNMKFAEIAQLSGIAKTDWSWAPLIADFDNDGWPDIFVTNGYERDVRDNDFLINNKKNVIPSATVIPFEEILAAAPQVKVPNYIYRNNGDLTFSNKVLEWGIGEPVNANGAAYADLDNDGDLDLVVNAMDDYAYVMRNDIPAKGNYLEVSLKGAPGNFYSVGTKVTVRSGDLVQVREVQLTRGFQSSVTPVLHFGLGNHDSATVEIAWNKNEKTVLNEVSANQRISLSYGDAEKVKTTPAAVAGPVFKEVKLTGLTYVHDEMNSDDFRKEILLPHKMSELGPFLSTADFDGNGFDDLVIGGSRGNPTEIFFQQPDGSFRQTGQPAFKKDASHEDMGTAVFDADNDNDLDLYIVSGSNECPANHPVLQDRLYLNDGKGNFFRNTEALPMMFESGQKVLAEDIDLDGWTDLVVFGRQVPENYPKTPKSFVLLNKAGKFVDATIDIAPEISRIGMVTDALFSDFDEDGDQDLLVVGEWMPLTILENEGGKFTDRTKKYGLENTVGWWSALAEYPAAGGRHYLVGNIGMNNKFHPTVNKPLQVYMDDFDTNGTNDIVLAKFQGNICYPVRGRECSSEQMPFIKEKFPTYSQFAEASLETIYSPEKLAAAIHFSAMRFETSSLFFSNGEFRVETLPVWCQLSAVNAILTEDFNGDGIKDVLMLGNRFEAEVETVRYDAGFGILLLGREDGSLAPVPGTVSGLYLNSDIKSAVVISSLGNRYVVTVPKREELRALQF